MNNLPVFIGKMLGITDYPVIKSRPKRSIIVLATVAIAFLFSLIGALLFDTYKDVNWKDIYHAK